LECELFFFVVLKVFEALQEFLFFFLRMGVKKQKQLRRHIRFYKTCFGFREPFKVICDGTFLHYNISKKLGSPQDILPSFLGAAAKAFVTRFAISASPYFDLVSVLCLGKPLNASTTCLTITQFASYF
jgi:hypothetical protein